MFIHLAAVGKLWLGSEQVDQNPPAGPEMDSGICDFPSTSCHNTDRCFDLQRLQLTLDCHIKASLSLLLGSRKSQLQ